MSIESYIISETVTIAEAMEAIDSNARGVVYICDGMVLKGVLTDGNVRRYIINGGQINTEVREAMNSRPLFLLRDGDADPYVYMEQKGITSIPILNQQHEIVSIKFLHGTAIHASHDLNVPVVIMAGGKGTRLLPLTQTIPKPLITIDDRTITEVIMDRFSEFGCNQFNMIVNYKKELIKSFFASYDKNYQISFTDELEFMGTGGGLKLLNGLYQDSFFLTNCDILVEEDYGDILHSHKKNGDIITMVCAMKKYTVPYGTVETDQSGCVKKFREKPSQTYLINTGLYVINPRFLEYIPDNTFIHITAVIEQCIANNERVGVYPVRAGSWWDMGQMKELEDMRKGFRMNREKRDE